MSSLNNKIGSLERFKISLPNDFNSDHKYELHAYKESLKHKKELLKQLDETEKPKYKFI